MTMRKPKDELNILRDGTKFWYLNGTHHRVDGPAIEYSSGSKEWFLNRKLHREDGPAIEYVNGHKEWWVDGKLRREDGPAIEWPDGSKSWYINENLVTELTAELKEGHPKIYDQILVYQVMKS